MEEEFKIKKRKQEYYNKLNKDKKNILDILDESDDESRKVLS
jgi:hypothetical protein